MLLSTNTPLRIDPNRGDAPHPDALMVCPGDQVNFYASIGNDGSVRESLQVAIYADANPNAYFFPPFHWRCTTSAWRGASPRSRCSSPCPRPCRRTQRRTFSFHCRPRISEIGKDMTIQRAAGCASGGSRAAEWGACGLSIRDSGRRASAPLCSPFSALSLCCSPWSGSTACFPIP